MKEKLYDYFLSGYEYDSKTPEEFDYTIKQIKSDEEFNEEFNKFIFFTDFFYYNNEKLVTSINSLDFDIKNDDLIHIIKLYLYAKSRDYIYHKYIISDFLLSLYNTLLVNKTKNDNAELYKEKIKIYKDIMKNYCLEMFFNEFSNNVVELYKDAVEYGISHEKYIAPNIVYKILNNLEYSKKKDSKRDVINYLMKKDSYIFIVIKYDENIVENKNKYLNFIKKIITQEYNVNSIASILNKLVNKNIIKDNDLKEIINLYIMRTNSLCEKYKNKDQDFIRSIAYINNLKNELVELNRISKIPKEFTEKIHECLINILSLKRYILRDDEYINSNMQKFSAETEIRKEDIDKFNEKILKNIYSIYGATIIDFDKCLEESIRYYSEFPMQSIFSNFNINQKNQNYVTNEAYTSNFKYSFEKYYEKLGKDYTTKHSSNLMNKLSQGYYIEMLKYLSRTFYLHQNITANMLREDTFNHIINEFKKELSIESDYGMIVCCILLCELNINQFLYRQSMNYSGNMLEKLDMIFDKFKEDKFIRNGVMFLFYCFYEHTGPNLRNEAAHGLLINKDLKIPLLLSITGLIFTSILINENK